MCSQCHSSTYCSVLHQRIDWTAGKHKSLCGSGNTRDTILFPEHEIVSDPEPEEEVPVLSPDQLASMMKESGALGQEDRTLELEEETDPEVDQAFLEFQKRVLLEPDQILRYVFFKT